MQRKTPNQAGRGKDTSGQADGNILSHAEPSCPNSPDCQKTWHLIEGADAAECGHCYQRLERSDLARMLEHPA